MVKPQSLFPPLEGRRSKAADFIEGSLAIKVITILILINAVTLGLETDAEIVEKYGSILYAIDRFILIIFTIELAIKFYAYRLGFFKSGWNIFDFIIVGITWLPASGVLAVLRSLRILRVLRLLSIIPQMRRVISAIGHSIPGMISVIGVLGVLFYVCSVLATKLFGENSDPQMQEWFGTIGASAYTLFQIMTLESWSMGIVRPVMELYPYAWAFFVPFIIVTSFAVLNLFIGIIVDAMNLTKPERIAEDEDIDANKPVTQGDLNKVLDKLNELQQELKNK